MSMSKFIGTIITMIIIVVVTNWYLSTYYGEIYNFLLEFVFELYEKKS